ncbi:MAG: 30S ribosomal protein S20 [Chloroflexi bacterium]|nr:30S ribosomal protein S20 [Chloroflexota bacterium]MCH2673326.1 30S ribosomal protein S20 [Dehalococcoidia bacterium]|tara:strand:+ start:551 stop:808 length:258 start_codon:yes stop_codon:yes gene_type:complete
MPSTKTHRNQLNKYKVNLSVKTAIKSSITKLRESIQKDDNSEEVNKLFKETSKVLDRAAKKKVIHKNNASRKKSRLQKLINKKNN